MLPDSSATVPCSLAYFNSLLEPIGRVSRDGVDVVGGRRKGSAPVGEEWLFEGSSW